MEEQHYAFQELMKLRKKSEALRLYALVDGIQYDRAIDETLKKEKGVCSLLSLPEDRALAFAGPWLLDVLELPLDFILKVSQLEKKYPAVSWIISEQTFLPLAEHLMSCLHVSFPSKQTGLFRFYDCRVLKTLPALLSSEQIAQLMKYNLQWLFLNESEVTCYQFDAGILSTGVLEMNADSKEAL